MWTYRQASGELYAPDGELVSIGYSGHGIGVNNPIYEATVNIGPTPRGLWDIGTAYTSPTRGPLTMRLTPHADTQTFGRSDFEIHGDSVEHAGKQWASFGCLIQNIGARERLSTSDDRTLKVE